MNKLIQTFLQLWRKIISFGVTDDLTFEEKKKTRFLNIIAFSGFPGSIAFALINTLQHRYPLVIINVLMSVGCLLILFINKQRKYLLGWFLLSLMSMVVFTAAAVYYKNGAEYFLLLNIVATVILFRNSVYVISISAANALIFLFIKIYHPEVLVEAVPNSRVVLNIAWTLFFIILALHFYKSEHLSYQQQVENTNRKLKEQQDLLLIHQDQLEQKSAELEGLNHTKEKLFSVIAHDMRTPIAGFKSLLDLFHNNIISKEEFTGLVQQLTAQVDNLYTALDNLLHWSHSQLNGIQAKPEACALKPLVLQTISLLLQTANQKKVHIQQQIPDSLMVFADPNHTKVILRNLLSNAIKFSHVNGCIEICARQVEDHVQIMVIDNGVGMNEGVLRQLFLTDINLTQTGTLNEKGTGLGLTLCKEFIEKNNGQILVMSEEGKGSTFTVLFPATIVEI